MYELLKQFENIGQRRLELEELRNILGLGKNTTLLKFQSKGSGADCKGDQRSTDISVSYKEEKKGQVAAILFKIWSDVENKYLSDALKDHPGDADVEISSAVDVEEIYEVPKELPEELKPVIQRLVEDFGFDITEAMSFAHKFDKKRIVENLDITEKRVRGIAAKVSKQMLLSMLAKPLKLISVRRKQV